MFKHPKFYAELRKVRKQFLREQADKRASERLKLPRRAHEKIHEEAFVCGVTAGLLRGHRVVHAWAARGFAWGLRGFAWPRKTTQSVFPLGD